MANTFEEKRLFPRVPFDAALQYRIRGKPETSAAVCDNISEDGLAFIDARFIAPHTPLMLEFNVLSSLLNPVGYVSWASPIPHSDRYRLGIKFLEFEQKQKELLSDFVQLQTNLL
jgi:hypothetical protein